MSDSKPKGIVWVIAVVVVLAGGFWIWKSSPSASEQVSIVDHKNAEYVIEGQPVKLIDGVAETQAAPGSASKIITRYFGNELKTDLNNDGREDVVFLLTQETGGSGTFYYVVAAVRTETGYIGSDGYLLGDRIIPQTTELSHNPRHRNVVVVNYADRSPGEPITTQLSVGKSVYLKLNPETMQWGVVVSDFEGESSSGIRGTVLLGPTCPVVMDPPDPNCADKRYATKLVVTTSDQSRVIKEFSSGADGTFSTELPPGEYAIRSAAAANVLSYCSHEAFKVVADKFTEITVSCDTGIR